MEITLTHLNEHQRELHINTSWSVVADDYSDLLKRYARLPVKGFRPGKTPRSATESFYRQQIKDDLLTLVTPRLCRTALKEKSMQAGTPIEIIESRVKPYESLQFKATFIEMPAFELPPYHHLHLQTQDTDAQLDEVSARLLELTRLQLPPVFVDNELVYSDLEGSTPTPQERADAEARVKLMLILKNIAEKDNIEVPPRLPDQRLEALAAEIESTPQEIKEYLQSSNGWARFIDTLLAEQVLQYIIDTQETS